MTPIEAGTDRSPAPTVHTRPVAARIATASLFLANGIGIGGWAGILPALQQRMDLSNRALSFALVGFATGAVISMLAAPRLVGRYGIIGTGVTAALCFALALLLPPLASGLPSLVVTAVLVGLTNGVLDVAMNTNATTVEETWRTPLMSSFHALFSLGGMAGALVVSLSLRGGLNPAGSMRVAALAVATLAVVSWCVGLRRGLAKEAPVGEAQPWRWPDRAVLNIAALAFLAMLIEGAMADWSGVFLTEVTGVSVAVAATAYAAFAVAMVLGRLFGDRIVRRLGTARILGLGAATAGSAVAIALAVPHPIVARICFAVSGLGLSNLVPVLFSAAARVSPNRPEEGVAGAALGGYAGFIIGPAIIGFMAGMVGLRPALLTLVLAAGTLAVMAPRLVRRVSG